MKRITHLTDEQKAAIPAHVAKWIAVGQATGEADWEAFERAARACYGFAGIPWPNRVVRVSSPLVGAFAAPIALHLLKGDGAVGGAVDGAVGGAVGGAVRGAVRGELRGAVGGNWYRYLGGQWWVNWQAWTSYFRDICNLELPGDLWERDRAYTQAQSSAGWWWPTKSFVMVSDRPRELHLEQVGPAGWGSHRLHRDGGPAISWADGWGLHYWHGTKVPADLVAGAGWAPDRILTERNAEIRRCAIERYGWDRFAPDAGLRQVGNAAADPGNPGQELVLYDLPDTLRDLYEEPARILVCANASLDRDGSRRRFGLPVPASISDPITAAAATFDLSPADYLNLVRAT